MTYRGMSLSVCLLCLCFFSSTTMAEPPSSRFGAQRFQLTRCHKAVISGQTLYMNTAPLVREEHQGRLIRVPLSGHPDSQSLWNYVGVYAVGWSESERRVVDLGNQYPFCWDIAGQDMVAIDIKDGWMRGGPFFVLARIPLADIPVLQERIMDFGEAFLGKNALSNMHPLEYLFRATPDDQRSRVFFDIVPYDRQTFHLYIAYEGTLTIWDYDPAVNELLRAFWRRNVSLSNEEWLDAKEKSWAQIRSVPVEFEGPFRVIRLNETIYIFSEHLRTVYRCEGEQLVPLIHLPPLPEQKSSTGLEQVFIVDKDHQRVIFWVPSAEHPDTPDVITLGDAASLPDTLVPAVQAAMTFMPPREE